MIAFSANAEFMRTISKITHETSPLVAQVAGSRHGPTLRLNPTSFARFMSVCNFYAHKLIKNTDSEMPHNACDLGTAASLCMRSASGRGGTPGPQQLRHTNSTRARTKQGNKQNEQVHDYTAWFLA
jgi:hypothetical protein